MSTAATHYDAAYFDWQQTIGAFGGWANAPRFQTIIKPTDDVLDFGCGGGYLLKNLKCKGKFGVEINPSAGYVAMRNDVKVFGRIADVPDDSADVIVSNHCLEHVPNPLGALVELRSKLRSGGLIMFVVPCETIYVDYDPSHIDHHLYTWNPMCFGHLFTDAGYKVISSKSDKFRWPPMYRAVAHIGGRFGFELAAKICYYFDRKAGQVRLVARKD